MKPKLTVLMTTYNGKPYLRSAIDSVLNQKYSDYVFYIIDDASSDGTIEIIQSYSDSRIKLMPNKRNIGQMASLNLAMSEIETEYVARIDQDDIALPMRFADEAIVLENNPDIGLVYTDSYMIDAAGRRQVKTFFNMNKPRKGYVYPALLRRNFIPGNTIMFRRALIGTPSYLNDRYKIAAEYEFLLRLSKICKFSFIDKKLAEYRFHDNNFSGNRARCVEETIKILASENKDCDGEVNFLKCKNNRDAQLRELYRYMIAFSLQNKQGVEIDGYYRALNRMGNFSVKNYLMRILMTSVGQKYLKPLVLKTILGKSLHSPVNNKKRVNS